MKKCPFCAEEIQDEAIKCRYCRETLVVAAESPSTAQGEPADQSSREWTGESSTDAPPVPVQPKSSTEALVEPAASTPSTTTPDAEELVLMGIVS